MSYHFRFKLKLFWQCLFETPHYRAYREVAKNNEPQGDDKWAHFVIFMADVLMNIVLYTPPLIYLDIYQKGTDIDARTYSLISTSISCVLALSCTLRAYVRAANPEYAKFINDLSSPMTTKKLHSLSQQFFRPKYFWCDLHKHLFSESTRPYLPLHHRIAIQVLAFVATRTFSLRYVCTRSMALGHKMLCRSLLSNWILPTSESSARFSKLLTADGNEINTMLVDRRNKGSKGKNLIICCEGNSGIFEFGAMTAPAMAGYSVLGWNRPGFLESTVLPNSTQEELAIKAVMLHAVVGLGFKPKTIVMYGWSVGGYAATWAAVNFNVKGLILDATFDDVTHLITNHVPSLWSSLMTEIVHSYLNLDIGTLITDYKGPVKLVRRLKDEVACLSKGELGTNRGNYLLMKLFEKRHPSITKRPRGRATVVKLLEMEQPLCTTRDEQLILSLISLYKRDVDSTHFTRHTARSFQDIVASL